VISDHGGAESQAWYSYFRSNRGSAEGLPWDDLYRLSEGEREAIRRSIQQFQLGEGAEGKALLKRGHVFALATGDSQFVEALALFIKEEQRHSADLLRFMQQQGIPALRGHWIDQVFRRIRVLAGLELELRVLVTAEIIAVPYYRALRRATQSTLLRALCQHILCDEAGHLRFQAFMLSRLEAERSPLSRQWISTAHGIFLLVTCGVVWLAHGELFAAGRCSLFQFLSEVLAEFSKLEMDVSARLLGKSAKRSEFARVD